MTENEKIAAMNLAGTLVRTAGTVIILLALFQLYAIPWISRKR